LEDGCYLSDYVDECALPSRTCVTTTPPPVREVGPHTTLAHQLY